MARLPGNVRTLLLSLAGFASCVSAESVAISRHGSFAFQAPRALGAHVALEQTVEASHRGESRKLECVLEVDSSEVRLVGLTPFGSMAFSLIYDGHLISVEDRTGGNFPADPREILASLQLCLWPELPGLQGLSVTESLDAKGRHRTLRRDSVDVISIHYTSTASPWEGTIEFVHHERDFALRIVTSGWSKLDT
jgi:hypothetical protein